MAQLSVKFYKLLGNAFFSQPQPATEGAFWKPPFTAAFHLQGYLHSIALRQPLGGQRVDTRVHSPGASLAGGRDVSALPTRQSARDLRGRPSVILLRRVVADHVI